MDGLAEERAANRRADRRALLLLAAIAAVSLLVEVGSRLDEIARYGPPISAQEVWLLEASSHAAILALACFIPALIERAPASFAVWGRTAAVYAAGALAFAVLHVAVMYGLRLALFPLVVGAPYEASLFAPRHFFYELRKDVLVYLMLLATFLLSRGVERARLEAEARLREAARERRLRLKGAGGVVLIDAADVLWVKAAGNYAELHTRSKSHFCRVSMSELERMFASARSRHARVHKSYIVNLAEIASIKPTGEGDVQITLADGRIVPGSRRYRAALAALTPAG